MSVKRRAFIYIITAGVLWGTSGLFVDALTPYGFSSLQITMLRGVISCLCMAIFVAIRGKVLFRVKPREIWLPLAIGVALFGTSSCYYLSMQMTSVSTAVVLMYMAPVYVMIYSVLFLGERLSGLKLFAVVAMFAGCCLVSGIVGGLKFDLVGILLGLLSGVAYGAYNILTKIALRKGLAPETTTFYSFVVMSVIALSVSHPYGAVSLIGKQPMILIPLVLALGLVTYVLPYLLYTKAMRTLPAGTASALGIVEPMAATVFSIAFLGERLSVLPAVGIVLILLAVFLLGKAEGKE